VRGEKERDIKYFNNYVLLLGQVKAGNDNAGLRILSRC